MKTITTRQVTVGSVASFIIGGGLVTLGIFGANFAFLANLGIIFTVVGALFLFVGVIATKVLRCESCQNKVDSRAAVCPVCGAQ